MFENVEILYRKIFSLFLKIQCKKNRSVNYYLTIRLAFRKQTRVRSVL